MAARFPSSNLRLHRRDIEFMFHAAHAPNNAWARRGPVSGQGGWSRQGRAGPRTSADTVALHNQIRSWVLVPCVISTAPG